MKRYMSYVLIICNVRNKSHLQMLSASKTAGNEKNRLFVCDDIVRARHTNGSKS